MMIIHMFQPLCTVLKPQILAISKSTYCMNSTYSPGCRNERILLWEAVYVSKAQDSAASECFLPLCHRITDFVCTFFLKAFCGSSSRTGAAVQTAAWSSMMPDIFCCFAKSHPQLGPNKSQLSLTVGEI